MIFRLDYVEMLQWHDFGDAYQRGFRKLLEVIETCANVAGRKATVLMSATTTLAPGTASRAVDALTGEMSTPTTR